MPRPYHINLRQAIYTLSDALDYVGLDQLLHSKRVAFLSRSLAEAAGASEEQMDTLTEGAILHDCGVSSTRVHERLVSELDWQGSRQHCARGFRLLSDCPVLAHHANSTLHHHTHWEDFEKENLTMVAALSANTIFLADRVDALIKRRNGHSVLSNRERVRSTIAEHRGSLFAPELVDAFLDISNNDALWLMLRNDYVKDCLSRWAEAGGTIPTGFRTLRGIATIFSSVVDAKSPYTAEHSRGVGRLARCLGGLLELPELNQEMLEIAGMLHDLGKLHVPDDVLEKPGPLNDDERLLIRHHSFDTFAILGRIDGFGDIARWAGDHHETVSGTGYPHGYTRDELPLESRILAVADVFQALAQSRPYRPAMPPEEILAHLTKMAGNGTLEGDIVDHVRQNLGTCWQAATAHTNA